MFDGEPVYDLAGVQEINSEVSVNPPIPPIQSISVSLGDGRGITGLLIPARMTYQKGVRSFSLLEPKKGGNHSVESDEAGQIKVHPVNGEAFSPDLMFVDLNKFTDSWIDRVGTVNPWMVSANLLPECYVVADVPNPRVTRRIIGRRSHQRDESVNICKTDYQPYGYVIERPQVMIERFSEVSGLGDRLSGVRRILAASATEASGVTELARSLILNDLSLTDAAGYIDSRIRRLEAEEVDESIVQFWADNLNKIALRVNQIAPHISASTPAVEGLSQLPDEILRQIEQTRVRIRAHGVVQTLLDSIPVAAFILHRNIADSDWNAALIAPAIQGYYDELGRAANFRDRDEFQTVLERALDVFLPSFPVSGEWVPGSKEYRDQVFMEAWRLIAVSNEQS
ncbi:MAG: hypothetical protein ACD_20C00336G0002 [uncultured bacterium]|nr:MAG: hypothetical protein ACD_20C00336G0002 [uncultured bacterium]